MNHTEYSLKGNLADVWKKKIYFAEISVKCGKISSIRQLDDVIHDDCAFIIPGFVDSHIHIESSMLVPSEFARLAVVHGTVGAVCDPHEIANVCGIQGIEFMLSNAAKVPFKFYFGAPSCVPATSFETSGAILNSQAVRDLLERDDIHFLSEMMNFPGVIAQDPEIMKKLEAARLLGKPVDGHAPGLRGAEAKKYAEAGISTDHECYSKEEALEKLSYGMKILIREGSAARNFDALIDILKDHDDQVMFCSDDKHPDSLKAGHINQLCRRAAEVGLDVFSILKAACVNPVIHYRLPIGLLRPGDAADFVEVETLHDFKVLRTYINGNKVANEDISLIASVAITPVNHFERLAITVDELQLRPQDYPSVDGNIPVIEAYDGNLITGSVFLRPRMEQNLLLSDPSRDILKIVVIDRYHAHSPVAKAFIKNIGIRKGAIASSVAHDSHNIVAVGTDDELITRAVNLIIEHKGGICCVSEEFGQAVLPLPVGGLMSKGDGLTVAEDYTYINKMACSLGTQMKAPFMTLSFMSLLVIPHLKLSDKGLFDGDTFSFLN